LSVFFLKGATSAMGQANGGEQQSCCCRWPRQLSLGDLLLGSFLKLVCCRQVTQVLPADQKAEPTASTTDC